MKRSVNGFLIAAIAACAVASAAAGGSAQTTAPPQTISAFKTTVDYQFTCNRSIYKLAIGARSQNSIGGEATIYWEIWDAGKTTTDEVENVANLNTLPVQPVASALQPNGFPAESKIVPVFRPCTQQSLYVWAAGSATKIGDDVIVHFSDAAERPLLPP
jgi:hypothetical protein